MLPENGAAAGHPCVKPPSGTAPVALRRTSKALSDLVRVHEFLASVNVPAAARAVQGLTNAPAIQVTNPRVGENPRVGKQLFMFEPREVNQTTGRLASREQTDAWLARQESGEGEPAEYHA